MDPLDLEIGAAVTKAVESLPLGACEVCGGKPALPYGFAFAKRYMFTGWGMGTAEQLVTESPYEPVQGLAVNLCDSCVLKYWRAQRNNIRHLARALSGVGMAILLVEVALVVALGASSSVFFVDTPEGGGIDPLVLLASVVGLVLTPIYPIWWLGDGRHPKNWRTAGDELALSLHRERLEQERNVCWLYAGAADKPSASGAQ